MIQAPRNFLRRNFLGLATAFLGFALACCGSTVPKVFSNGQVTFTNTSTTISSSFVFNFAYRNPLATAPLSQVIFLQGSDLSKSVITSTCNYAGTGCVCQFLDASNNVLSETTSAQVSYDTTSNLLKCQYTGSLATLARIRVRNQNSSVISDVYSVDTTLTLAKLVGTSLDVNKVRTVSRYACLYNFLQKQNTTALTFDCSHQSSACWFGFTNAQGYSSGDFCLLQTTFPFFVYAGNYDNNLNLKMSDLLYNAAGTGLECGIQVKQYDCSGANGTTVKQFGLYADQAGIFQYPLSLTPAPGQTAAVYGFAAAPISYLGYTLCPPGTVNKILYTASTASAAFGPSSNYSTALVSTEVMSYGTPPASNLLVSQVGGGYCDGTNCSLPGTVVNANYSSFTYSSAGQTQFCAIDPALL